MRFTRGDPPLWPESRKDEVGAILLRYPEPQSALMPLLHLAQEERGYLAQEDLEAVARILGLTTAYVDSVASFYAMYHGHPTGRYVVTVCANLACHLAGAGPVLAALEGALGIRAGETTADGLITLEATSECLGACDAGPVLQVNAEYFLRLTPARAEVLVAALRAGDAAQVAELAEAPDTAAAILLPARVTRLGAGPGDAPGATAGAAQASPRAGAAQPGTEGVAGNV